METMRDGIMVHCPCLDHVQAVVGQSGCPCGEAGCVHPERGGRMLDEEALARALPDWLGVKKAGRPRLAAAIIRALREERQRRFLCSACDGDGKVMRMTDAYAGMVAVANGQPFSWTGETHEWRTCRICGGTGLLS